MAYIIIGQEETAKGITIKCDAVDKSETHTHLDSLNLLHIYVNGGTEVSYHLTDSQLMEVLERMASLYAVRMEEASGRVKDGMSICGVCGDSFNNDQLVWADDVNIGEYDALCNTCYRRVVLNYK